MGQIISLQDGVYKYELPPVPPEPEILFCDATKKDQYIKTPNSKDFDRLFVLRPSPNGKQLSKKQHGAFVAFDAL